MIVISWYVFYNSFVRWVDLDIFYLEGNWYLKKLSDWFKDIKLVKEGRG